MSPSADRQATTEVDAEREVAAFPLLEAPYGRGSHRFALGDDRVALRDVHDDEFKACIALQAQYVLDTFGKFPRTVPTVFILNYVQAHHLDLEPYDRLFKPGAYPWTHAGQMERRRHRKEEG